MFVLLANCNFVPGRYDEVCEQPYAILTMTNEAQWQEAYDHLGQYVWQNEPTTLTYYFGLPIQNRTHKSDTTHMLAFECYTRREALYETHFNSSAMASFLTKIPTTMTTGLDLNHYEDTSGFLDKTGDRRECEVMRDIRITCKPEAREALLKRLSKAAERFEKDSSFADTWTFLVLRCLDNDHGIRIFERFQTWKAMDKHSRAEAMLDFWSASKEEIASMESQVYVPNGKGWLHRNSQSRL